MACDGSSRCGCTCVCWCEVPQVYYPCGIYEPSRPIPDALAFQPPPPVSGPVAPPSFEPVRPYVDGGGLGPPGAPAGPSIIDWGPKRPPPPGPHFGGGGKFQSRVWGWDDDRFLSPPPLEALRHREPGPVAFPPTAKVRGPGEESRSEEARSLAATWTIGDPSGAIQTPGGLPVAPTAVRPPDSFLGVQEPPPYLRAALAPPQAGEFLQGAGLGPGAGVGSEGSDQLGDNGTSMPMDPYSGTGEPQDDFPLEPGDPPLAATQEPLSPPALPNHPMGGVASNAVRPRSPFDMTAMQGGGSWRPQAGSRPSVRPGIGFSHGRTNPGFAASVDANRKFLDAARRVAEAKAEGKEAEKIGDVIGTSNALIRETFALQDRKAALQGVEAANAEATGGKGEKLFDPDRAMDEAFRQHEREEGKLVKMSAGSGDVAAARTAAANLRAATDTRDRATRLSAAAASTRQDDRVRTADARVHQAKADLALAQIKDPKMDPKEQKDRLDQMKATAARTREEARSPKARQEFKKRQGEAKKAAKEARKASQEARKAARREKNAARYGPKAAVERARAEAARLRQEAEDELAKAEEANRRLTDPEDPLVPPAAGAVSQGPPSNQADCTCDPPCPAFAECRCQCVVGPEGDGAGEGGIKGKHTPKAEPVAPPDSGEGPRKEDVAFELSEKVRREKEAGLRESGDDGISTGQRPSGPRTEPPPRPKKKLKGGPRGPNWVPMESLRTMLPQDSPLPTLDDRGGPADDPTYPSPEPIPPLQPPESPPPPDNADTVLLKEMARTARALERERWRIEKRLRAMGKRADRFYRKLEAGKELSPREEAAFGRILQESYADGLAAEFLDSLLVQVNMAAFGGIGLRGDAREAVLQSIRGIEDAGRMAREIVDAGLRDAEQRQAANDQARIDAGRSFSDQDFDRATALIQRAFQEPQGSDISLKKADRANAWKELKALKLDPKDSLLSREKIAVALFRQRRDAEMNAADEATSWLRIVGEGFGKAMEPVGRGLAAVAKLTEAAVTGLQAFTAMEIAARARMLKSVGLDIPFLAPETFETLASNQLKSHVGAYEDAWRNIINRDLDKVRNRITDGTLGGATVFATADEHQAGVDPLLEWARATSHFTTAAAEVSLNALATGVPGGGLGSVAGNAKALAALKAFGGGGWRALQKGAVALPKTAKAWVEEARGVIRGIRIRSATGGGIPPGGVVAEGAEETATFLRKFKPDEWKVFQEGLPGQPELKGVLRSRAQQEGVEATRGLRAWYQHSLDSGDPLSPYVSMTKVHHIADEFRGVLVRVTVPKSAVIKGANFWQAEYLVPGGTRAISAEAIRGTLTPYGATARWLAETVGIPPAIGVPLGVGGRWAYEEVKDYVSPEASEQEKR